MTLKVEFGLTKSGDSFVYNDITTYVIGVGVDRGKSNELSTFDSGSCNVQLNNIGRVFDPSYAGSPYAGQIAPGAGLRVWVDDHVIYTGIVRSWDLSYELDGQSFASINAQDAFSILSLRNMDDYSPSGDLTLVEQTTGDRMATVLNHIAWPTSQTVIPVDTKGNLEADTPSEGTSVLTYLQSVEASEPGKFFTDADGNLVFKSAYDSIYESAYTYTRQNISNNPSFESDTYNWPYNGGTAIPARTTTYGGATVYGGAVTSGSYSVTIPAGSVLSHNIIPTPDIIYTASAFFRSTADNTVTWWADGSTDGTTWVTQGSASTVISAASGVPVTDWQRAYLTWTPTSDYNKFRLRVSTAGAGNMDAVLVEASAFVNDYFDGVTRPADTASETFTGGWN